MCSQGKPAAGGWDLLQGGIPACTEADNPVNRMTDRCKNITLPQTSFAGGNYIICERKRMVKIIIKACCLAKKQVFGLISSQINIKGREVKHHIGLLVVPFELSLN